jgi:hypothetical protein
MALTRWRGGRPSVTAYGMRHTLFSTSLKFITVAYCRLLFLLCAISRWESCPPPLLKGAHDQIWNPRTWIQGIMWVRIIVQCNIVWPVLVKVLNHVPSMGSIILAPRASAWMEGKQRDAGPRPELSVPFKMWTRLARSPGRRGRTKGVRRARVKKSSSSFCMA